jgi:hypothetical protein
MMGMRGVRGVAVLLAVIVGFVGRVRHLVTRPHCWLRVIVSGVPVRDDKRVLRSYMPATVFLGQAVRGIARERSDRRGRTPLYGGACAFDLDDTEAGDCSAYIEFEVKPVIGVMCLTVFTCVSGGYPQGLLPRLGRLPAAYANVQFFLLNQVMVEISTWRTTAASFVPMSRYQKVTYASSAPVPRRSQCRTAFVQP